MKQIEIKTLEDISTTDILDCFNKSFSDYLVPVSLALAQLEDKIQSENILKEYSIGAFDNDQLIGFILHGYDVIDDRKVLYNAGTGVIPDYRGQNLTEKMYTFGLRLFKEIDIKNILLEAITENLRAIKVYERIGFKTNRTVICYKGEVKSLNKQSKYPIKKIDSYNWDEFKSFQSYKPTWQNSIASIIRSKENLEIWGSYDDDVLVGYIIYIPERKRVQLFAVKPEYRRLSIAYSLFNHVTPTDTSEISVVNVDAKDSASNHFLQTVGLHDYIRQYEMSLSLD